ncbi:MAG: hypothetical protein FWC70_05505 [Defluviitaleaceae bacterium]|nr:hypothetical protein [Defluviitaleaceae bacterium]
MDEKVMPTASISREAFSTLMFGATGTIKFLFNMMGGEIDYKKKFRIVLEHDPEKPSCELTYHQED